MDGHSNLSSSQWLVRLGLLAAGLLAARQALYVFYFQPYLGATSWLDPWLERSKCLIAAWCGPDALAIHHGGALFVLAAVVCFGLALRTDPGDWPVSALPSWPEWQSRPRATRVAVLLFGLMAAEAILYAFYRRWAGGESPTVITWIAGVCALLAAAILWDLEEHSGWARTTTDMLAYAGIVAATLGAGALLARAYPTALLLPAGMGLVWLAGLRSGRAATLLRPLDYWLMLGFSLLALILAMSRARQWQFTFVGDEWVFYRMVQTLLAQPHVHINPFMVHDSDRYHIMLPSMISAWTMGITSTDAFGWRLTSVLPFVWSVPAVYVLGFWLARRTAAWLSAALFAGAHVLLAFALVPKNITWSLLTLTFVLAALVWAEGSRSAFRYALAGAALGLGYLMHSLALLVILPVAVILIAQGWTSWRRTVYSSAITASGFLATAAPLLLDLDHWRALLKATPVQSEVASKFSIAEQAARNVTMSLFAFMSDAGSRNNHFVAAGHTEPVTAVLMLMGIGCTLVALPLARRVRTWWLAIGLFWLAVAAIQQYGYLAITRIFVLVPVYALLAGVGGSVMVRLLIPSRPGLRQMLAVLLAVAGLSLNQFHIDRVSLPLGRDSWFVYPFLVQQLQAIAAQGDDTTVVVVTKRPDAKLTGEIVQAYGLGAHMPVLMDGSDFLASKELCAANDRPMVVLVTPDPAQQARIQRKIAACWTGYDETVLTAPWERAILYRYATAEAARALPPLDTP